MKGFSPPIRFVIFVVALWVGLRLATFTEIYPQDREGDRASPTTERLAASPTARGITPPAADRAARDPFATARADRPGKLPALSARFVRALTNRPDAPSAAHHQARFPAAGDPAPAARQATGIAANAVEFDRSPIEGRPDLGSAGGGRDSRWSLSGWSLWRSPSGTPSLASGGQLGGSQAGLRVGYRLIGDPDRNLALNFRLSRPIHGPDGAEAAVGVAIRPVDGLPIEILAERRIAIEQGGRAAWALGVAGGIDGVALPFDFELGGWAQAGIVGARSRDLYAEGAIGVRRPVLDAGRTTLSVGAAGWAAAQPGAARLDLGPEASLSFPVGDGAMRLGVSWRQRIAGDATPGSGPAITLGTDF